MNFFIDYGTLGMAFLTHFQLPIRYETGTELLTSLRQNTSTHISDHIHEWRRRRRLIKAQIPDQLLADWFTKSLLPTIARDVAMGGAITEEQAISRAQYLDLVYSQLGTLYDIVPNAPRPTNDPSRQHALESHADGTIGSMKSQSQPYASGKKNAPAPSPPASATDGNAKQNPTPEKTSEVNAVQSSQQSRGKKKANKNKNKKADT